jgi:hypothetical protein
MTHSTLYAYRLRLRRNEAEDAAPRAGEAGGGMPKELRDRIALVLCPKDWEPPTDKRGDDDPEGKESQKRWVAAGAQMMASLVLAEIAAAGFELVEKERMDRLRNAAGRDDAMNLAWRSLLKPGDLDRPEGRE